MAKSKIEIPRGISPHAFFLEFVPEVYAREAKEVDMSAYADLDLSIQFDIRGDGGGVFGVNFRRGSEVVTSQGALADADMTYSFDRAQFDDALAGKFPWISLDAAFDPEALRESLPPGQVDDEIDMLADIEGQADIRIERTAESGGGTATVRVRFGRGAEPAVTFHTREQVAEEIRAGSYTVMEAFMASKIKVEGPMEFAMHVMALVPDRED
jgi:hypothetical protein